GRESSGRVLRRAADPRWRSAHGGEAPRDSDAPRIDSSAFMALRLITAGESHGPGLTCIVEGLPAGLKLAEETLNRDMARRQLGHGRGGRMKIERDRAEVTAGVRHGTTLGGPIA